MAKKTILKKTILKKKKKKWFPILASKEFDHMEIGETPSAEPTEIIGKKVVVNFMHLTNDIKKQNTKIHFKVNEVKDDKAYTEIVGISMSEAYTKRVVKKARNKLEDSFKAITKDNIPVQIKPFVITKNETKGSVLASLRKKTQEFLTHLAKENSYDSLLNLVLMNDAQKKLRENLKKIYPIAVSEIRVLEKRTS